MIGDSNAYGQLCVWREWEHRQVQDQGVGELVEKWKLVNQAVGFGENCFGHIGMHVLQEIVIAVSVSSKGQSI
jgi:hypothetical protein